MKNGLKGFFIGVIITCMLFAGTGTLAESVIKAIDVAVNSVKVVVNGKLMGADNFVYNGRTYIQVKELCDILDKEIVWDEKTLTAYINDKKAPVTGLPVKDIEDSKKDNEAPINKEYVLNINGVATALEVPIAKSGDDYLVYYKNMAESMDVVSQLNFDTQTLTFKPLLSAKVLKMTIGKNNYAVGKQNGENFEIEQNGEVLIPPAIANSRVCIPLKGFVAILGGTVTVDDSKKIIHVTYEKAKNLKRISDFKTYIKINNEVYLYSLDLARVAAARDNTFYIHPEDLNGLLSINYNNHSIIKVENENYKGKILPTKQKYYTINANVSTTGVISGEGVLVNDDLSKSFNFRIKDNEDLNITRDLDKNPYVSIADLFNNFNIKYDIQYNKDNKSLVIIFDNVKLQ